MTTKENALSLRPQVTAKYRNLCEFTEAYQKLATDDLYLVLIKKLDSLTDHYNKLVHARERAGNKSDGVSTSL